MLNCARPCHDMQRIDVQCTYKYSWSMRKCMCMIHIRWAFCALLTLFGWRLTCRTRDGADSRSHRWTSARTQGLVFLFGQAVVRGLELYCLCSLEQTLFSLLASPRSVVFDQAENRLHAQKARMLNWPAQPMVSVRFSWCGFLYYNYKV